MHVDQAKTFDPARFSSFRFTERSIDPEGRVSLGYALDDGPQFVERFEVPVGEGADLDGARVRGLLALLHWIAGVSYYKAALPPSVAFEAEAPPPATARLLEALYSEGLGELAVVNELPDLPRPSFAGGGPPSAPAASPAPVGRVLVPVGGGKDSAVALEAVRRSGAETALFSIGDAAPIRRTAEVAGLPRLQATRRIDPQIVELNRRGAINGHVPVTAIVAAAALLTAELHGFDAVALANERSASAPNLVWHGTPVNHQFSKSATAEGLLREALAELGGPQAFSVLRPASELAIARAFARLPEYHGAFTSCNRVFRLDPELRSASWCGECDKCRFVFLILAPFLDPADLERIFGRPMLDEPEQYEGFALLTGTGGHKPFECVGEVEESVAAIRLLAADPRWRERPVVRRLADEVLPLFGPGDADPQRVLELRGGEEIPPRLLDSTRALLGS